MLLLILLMRVVVWLVKTYGNPQCVSAGGIGVNRSIKNGFGGRGYQRTDSMTGKSGEKGDSLVFSLPGLKPLFVERYF